MSKEKKDNLRTTHSTKRIAYRDSKTGEFISEGTARRKNPATWERQHIPTKPKGGWGGPPKKK